MQLNKLKSILLFSCFLMAALSVDAQKFGYLNSAELLEAHPKVKAANSTLETYQKQLMSQGEAMVKKFETNYQALAKEAQEGVLSQVQMQKKEAELAEEQQKIQAFEVEVQNKILKKREELYSPILDEVKVILESIGKEQGYTMIFDSSGGTILHANDSENVMSQVKSKLGI